jgi:hypothetical protein
MGKYKNLLGHIGNILQKEGFLKKGNTFYIKKNDNWGILDFQKSRSSTSFEVLFTINIGISLTILKKFNNENLKQKPEIEKSHWSERIGFLLPEKKDHWWKINNDTVLDQLTNELSELIVNIAIPEILNHITNESLEMEWLSGVSSGLTELQRYIYLTTLLKLNNNDTLPLHIEKLKFFSKGKPYEEIANEHIKALGF